MRYSALSGIDVKTYVDVSAYRNILDMLNTLAGVVERVGDDAAYTAWGYIGLGHKRQQSKALKGAAINAIGKAHGPGGNETYYWWARSVSRKYGFKAPSNSTIPSSSKGNLVDSFAVRDLLNLGRNIEWEMNRVRLSVPHNFRQYLDKLVSYNWRFTYPAYNPRTGGMANDSAFGIKLIEGIAQLGKLKGVVKDMQLAVRKEIDAANLAAQVQEETLRKEQEELITRKQAEELALKNAQLILKEKEETYSKDAATIADRKQKLISAREQFTKELETVTANLPNMVDPSALAAAQNRLGELSAKLAQIADDERNIDVLSETLINAVQNLNTDNTLLRHTIAEIAIQRNREKSQAIRDLEKSIIAYRATAQEKIDFLLKQRKAEADKQAVLEKQGGTVEEVTAVKHTIAAIDNTVNQIVTVADTDLQALNNADAQKNALAVDTQIQTEKVAIQNEIDQVLKTSSTSTGDAQLIAEKLSNLTNKLDALNTTESLNNANIDILKNQAQTLEAQVTPTKPKVNLLPLLGLVTFILSKG